eukprot:CAMPEP_0181301050 /NCGR_PEP_ID=MMETSP1101-20121128/7216_1 /TAXON_ID=46948 /ORGANISM="Rhodomonas abbreviata, Strain Caron Lab Isolate" /LENGTH=239 /DNA_ID=CAMNT_0023406327 /DNA_START=148 /DNA_END=864 /DNA_ORIENTATION=-
MTSSQAGTPPTRDAYETKKFRKGASLNQADAILIYLLRPKRCPETGMFLADSGPSPSVLARRYNIASKTIRDIWNRVTWSSTTRPHWSDSEIATDELKEKGVAAAPNRKPGRPQGAKDSAPRKRNAEDTTPIALSPTDVPMSFDLSPSPRAQAQGFNSPPSPPTQQSVESICSTFPSASCVPAMEAGHAFTCKLLDREPECAEHINPDKCDEEAFLPCLHVDWELEEEVNIDDPFGRDW